MSQGDSTNSIGENFKLTLLSNGQSAFYNGYSYIGYPARYFKEGYPFFGSDGWYYGSLVYDGKRYDHIPIMYDITRDEVFIQHFNKVLNITPLKAKLQMFNVDEIVNPGSINPKAAN